MTTRRSRTRRVARVVLLVLAAIATLITLAIGAALVVLHTDWGRDQVRKQLVAALADSVNGTVKVGRIEGSVLGEIVARDVVIEDLTGRPVIELDVVRTELALLDLASNTIRLEHLYVEGGQVVALAPIPGDPGEDEIELRSVVQLFEKEKKEEPSPWAVRIDELRLSGLTILWSDGTQEGRIEELGGTGKVAVERNDGGVAATIDLRGRWRERQTWVRVAAEVETDPEEVRVASALVSVDFAKVVLRDVSVRGTAIAGGLELDVPAGAWVKVWPDGPIVGSVHLDAQAKPGATPTTIDVSLAGDLAGAAIRGDLALDQEARHVRGFVATDGFDAAALIRDATPTAIDLHVAVDGGLAPGAEAVAADTVIGNASLRVGGTAAGARVDDLAVAVGAEHGWVSVLAGAVAPGRSRMSLAAHGRVEGDTVELVAARLIADVPQIQALVPDLKARGAVAADLRISGKLGATRRLDVAGTVRGRRLWTEAFAAQTATIVLDGKDLLGRPAGRVRAEVNGVAIGGDPMGQVKLDARSLDRGRIAIDLVSWPPMASWRVDVSAVAEVALPNAKVALGDWKLRTRDVDWIGRGGTIVLDERRVEVRNLKANLEGGALSAAATYYRVDGGRRRAGDVDVTAQVAGTDLGAFDRAFDLGGAVGRADVDVAIQRHGRALHGNADIALRGVGRIPGGPSLDLATSVTIAPRRITIDGALAAGIAGSATFGVDVVPPRQMTDAAAWQRLDRRALTAEVIVPKLDLARLALIAGAIDPPVKGTIEGRMTWSPTTTTGRIVARDVKTPQLPGGADLTLTVAPAGGPKLAIAADADVKGVGEVALKATVALPVRPLDLAAWAKLDQRAIDGATIRGDDLSIAGITKLLDLPPGWTGRGRIAVDIAPALRDARIAVGAYGLRGGPLTVATDLDAVVTADGRAVEAHLTSRIAGLTAMTARARFGVGVDALRRMTPAQRSALPLDATVTMKDVAIGPLLRAAGRRERLIGTVNLTATASGTLAEPRAKATWSLSRLRSYRRDLGRLDGDLRFDGELLTASLRGTQRGGGRLRIEARYPLADPAGAMASFEAARFDVAAIAALAPDPIRDVRGKLDAELRVRGGDPATLTVAGIMRLRDGELPVAPVVGTLREATVDVSVQHQRITLKADGKLGDGRARLDGTAKLAGILPNQAALELSIDDVILLNELQPTVDARVKTTVTRTGLAGPWKAEVVVSGARVVIPKESGRDLDPVGVPDDIYYAGQKRQRPERAKVPRPGPDLPLAEPFLIADIVVKPVEIRSEEVRASVSGKFTTSVGDDGIRIVGAIDAPRGTLTLFDRRYQVERASVRFDGPPDPRLDVRVVHAFPEMTLYVEVTGRASEPKVALRSDPPQYSQGELLGILLGGKPGEGPKSVGETAGGAASSFVSQKVVDYVGGYLPIDLDVLKVEGPTSGSGSGASLTVGKWVSRSLFVAYRQRVEAKPDQNAGEAEVEYWLRPRVVVEGIVGDRGIHGLDLLWTRRW